MDDLIPMRPIPPRWRRRAGAWLAAALLAVGALSVAPVPTAQADPNLYEQRDIEEDALRAFRQMITLWREELYFELYDDGWSASRERISKEEFAKRMVELAWVPAGDPDPKFLKTDFRYRTMVYVHARLLFQNKFNPAQSFSKDNAALLLKEDGKWRIDLVQLVRSPYSS